MSTSILEMIKKLDVNLSSIRPYRLMQLLNIAGVDSAEDIVYKMISNPVYLSRSGVQKKMQAGDTIYFGKRCGEGDPHLGDPMTWIVLRVDGEQALLLSEYALGVASFANTDNFLRFDYCIYDKVIEWLRGLSSENVAMFSAAEKASIKKRAGIDSGLLFFLSLDEYKELNNHSFGICECITGETTGNWLLRSTTAKEEEREQGIWNMFGFDGKKYADYVDMQTGEPSTTTTYKYDRIYLRPALKLLVSSTEYSICSKNIKIKDQQDESDGGLSLSVSGNGLLLNYSQQTFNSLESIADYLNQLFDKSIDEFNAVCNIFFEDRNKLNIQFYKWLSAIGQKDVISIWNRNPDFIPRNIYMSLRPFELLRLFSIAGSHRSEYIADTLLQNGNYLERQTYKLLLHKNSIVYFGHVGSSIPQYAGLPLVWRVMNVNDGKALLLCWYCFEKMAFTTANNTEDWKNSTIRQWLLNDFLNSSFSADEVNDIIPIEVNNGNDEILSDNVTLLSNEEIEQYIDADSYACIDITNPFKEEDICWWSRSIIKKRQGKFFISENKEAVHFSCNSVSGLLSESVSEEHVRPVICIDINSNNYSVARSLFDNYLLPGGAVQFGNYTQGEHGERAPIQWMVYKVEAGKAVLVSKYILAWRAFSSAAIPNNDTHPWINSDLCEWLNTTFINDAFTEKEQRFICEVNSSIDDDTYAEFCPVYAVPNTSSRFKKGIKRVKVYCMSFSTCPGIGSFKYRKHADHSPGPYSAWKELPDRPGKKEAIAKPTALAIKEGAPAQGNCGYWLMSLGKGWGSEASVDKDGWLLSLPYGYMSGVRPVISIALTKEVRKYLKGEPEHR